jgi:drug/metabolite transporter (DMT)-like permease
MQQDTDRPGTGTNNSAAVWYGVLVLGVLAASASGTIVKIAQEGRVPAIIIAAFRNYVACAALLPFFLRGSWREIARLDRREKSFMVLSGLILAAHFTMWTLALERTSVASATIFVTTTPIFVVLGSHHLLREKASPLIFVGIAVSIVGGVLVVGADIGRFAGDLLALLGAVGASAYMLIGRRIRPKLHLVAYAFTVYGIAAVALTVTAIVMRCSFLGYTATAYAMMVLLGLISSLIGHTCINFVLRHLRSYIVSVAMLGEPVAAAILAFFFIHEIPEWLEIIGCGVMLAGIYLSIRFSDVE